MNALGRTAVLGASFALAMAFTTGLLAQAEPAVGTWKLNVAKSKFSGPGPQSATLRIEAAGQGVKITTEGVSPTGSKTGTSYTASFDGKDYPITGSANADTVSLKRVNGNTVERTDKKGGKVTVVITRVLSADGKTLTITTKGTNAQGQAVNGVAIYEKQ